jgi:MFS family permease
MGVVLRLGGTARRVHQWPSDSDRSSMMTAADTRAVGPLPREHPPASSNGAPAEQVQRRVLSVLVLTQLLGGAGVTTGVAVTALLAARLSGSDVVGGLASTCAVVGAAVSATLIAWIAHRWGRRPALVFGYATGAGGALGATVAVLVGSWPLLLVASVPFGASTAANLAARFAATDLAAPHRRARAIAIVLCATTVGAVAGPNLAYPAQHWADAAGLVPDSGPYLLCAVTFGLAAIGILTGLRPDPLLIARSVAPTRPRPPGSRTPRLAPPARLAIAAIVVAHLLMVGVMSMTPVHMGHGGAGLRVVGIVISTHVAAMYALSPLFGWLADRIGRFLVLGLGAVFMIVAGIMAGAAGHDVVQLSAGLVALGLGWSAILVTGSALLTDTVPTDDRARVQGRADTAMNVSGALGGALAGLMVAGTSYTVLALAAAALSAPLLIGIVVVALSTPRDRLPVDP